MTNRFKDFGGTTQEYAPLSFKIHGEEFQCRPAIQGKVLLSIVANSSEDDSAAVARTITEFFEKTLLPESYERFNTLLSDPDKIVTVETLGEITAWMVEEYSSRPTSQPEPSSSGQ
jgi:hypothetical protein